MVLVEESKNPIKTKENLFEYWKEYMISFKRSATTIAYQKESKSYLILLRVEYTPLIVSAIGGASNDCVCRQSWATSPNPKQTVNKVQPRNKKHPTNQREEKRQNTGCPFSRNLEWQMLLPRSPKLLYNSRTFDLFFPHASSSAAITVLPPIFNSWTMIRSQLRWYSLKFK